jgi:hypothetical protein
MCVKDLIMAVPGGMFKDSSARMYSRDIAIEYDARRAHRLLAEKRKEVFMDARICKYASALVLSAALGMAGCVKDGVFTDHVTGPSTLTPALVTVEPAAVLPVFLSSPFCGTLPLFQTGFTLVFRADQDLFISGFGFEFLDGFGVRSAPTLISTSSTFAPLVPVPLPSSSPVPIPGVSSFNGLMLSRGSSRTLPMLLQFGCGVPASGTLTVSVNTASRGTADVTQVSVRIVG